MTSRNNIKVIFDTNIWISFLIGKKLRSIKELIADHSIIIILTDQLLTEIKEVTRRPGISKYFPENNVNELIIFLNTVAEVVPVSGTNLLKRDPKDSFLLDLIEASQADYLVTGDNDLLSLGKFRTTEILYHYLI